MAISVAVCSHPETHKNHHLTRNPDEEYLKLVSAGNPNEWNEEELESEWILSDKRRVWLNFTEANKQISDLIKHRYTNETAVLKKSQKSDKKTKKQKDCHSIAMLECGCQSLKTFEDTLKRTPFVKVETRCNIRKKFFKCLDAAVKAPCKRQNLRFLKPKSAYEQQKQEIVRILWTTRECMLGAVDQGREETMSTAELKINSRFCHRLLLNKTRHHRKP